jgi:hypothetical protein
MPIHYGNVHGNVYSARQQEAPAPEERGEGNRPPKKFQSKLTKKCIGCGKVLPLDSFTRDPYGEYGRYRYCSKCNGSGVKYKMEGYKQ